MIDFEIENFAKQCAVNYKKGVEFSFELSYGKTKSTYHFPRGIEELRYLSMSRLKEVFKDCVQQFMDKATLLTDNSSLHIKILPLISRNYKCVMTIMEK